MKSSWTRGSPLKAAWHEKESEMCYAEKQRRRRRCESRLYVISTSIQQVFDLEDFACCRRATRKESGVDFLSLSTCLCKFFAEFLFIFSHAAAILRRVMCLGWLNNWTIAYVSDTLAKRHSSQILAQSFSQLWLVAVDSELRLIIPKKYTFLNKLNSIFKRKDQKCRELISFLSYREILLVVAAHDVNLIKNSGETSHIFLYGQAQLVHSYSPLFCPTRWARHDDDYDENFLVYFHFSVSFSAQKHFFMIAYRYFWCVSWKSSYCLLT